MGKFPTSGNKQLQTKSKGFLILPCASKNIPFKKANLESVLKIICVLWPVTQLLSSNDDFLFYLQFISKNIQTFHTINFWLDNRYKYIYN